METTCERKVLGIDDVIEMSLQENAKILIDTSIFSPKQNFISELYECRNYRKLDIEKISIYMERLEPKQKFIWTPNTLVLQDVISEFENFEKIIYKKNSIMERVENRKNYSKKNKEHARVGKEENMHRNILNSLCLQVLKIRKGLRAKLFEPKNQELYEETYKLMVHLNNKLQLKRDSCHPKDFFNPIRDKSKPEYNTDEKIVSAGLLLSLNKNIPVNIISSDGHLQTLAGSYSKLIENKDFEKYHEQIKNKLEKAPIKVFYHEAENDSYICEIYISSIRGHSNPMKLFVSKTSNELSKEETDEIRKRITSNLENLLKQAS